MFLQFVRFVSRLSIDYCVRNYIELYINYYHLPFTYKQFHGLSFFCISFLHDKLLGSEWQSGGGKIQEGLRPEWMISATERWYVSRVEIGIAKWPKNCNEPGGHKYWEDSDLMLQFVRFFFVFLEEIHWDASVSCGYTKMDDAPLFSNAKDTVKIDGLMIIQLCLVTSQKNV